MAKKKVKKRRIQTKKEEVCETFNIKKDGKKQTVTSCGVEEDVIVKKDQLKSENKILKWVLIIMGALLLLVILIWLVADSMSHILYKGVSFDIVKEGNLVLYSTFIPVKQTNLQTGKVIDADYVFYLRNDPGNLDKINFNGDIKLSKKAVINVSGRNFNCDGDGIIGVANLQKMYNILGVNLVKDANASCDDMGRYMFIEIEPGDKTEIIQTGILCYTIKVKDCEILRATEKMMVETFVKYNEIA